MPDETDAFGRPVRPEGTDPFGAPVEPERESQAPPGWAPPTPPPAEPPATWEPPLSPDAPPGEPSGWWRRVGAAIVDGLIIGVVAAIIGAVLTSAADASEDATTGIGLVVGLVLGGIYYGLTMSRGGEHNGQTWGKQAASIRVVRTDAQPITFGFTLVRELLVKTIIFGYLAIVTLYIATILNYLWPLWDVQNRALHDRMVHTLVRKI